MKVLSWDGDGLVIWFKRLEKGTFSYSWGSVDQMDRKTFLMLLEGVIPKKVQARYKVT
jgi:transposase